MKNKILTSLTVVALGVVVAGTTNAQDRRTPYIPQANPPARNGGDRGSVQTVTRFFNGYFPNSDDGGSGNGNGNRTPISPFILRGSAGNSIYGWNGFNNEVFSYTSPVSPFALYRGNPNVNRFRYRNGMWGRGAISFGWGGWIFPGGNAFYPY